MMLIILNFSFFNEAKIHDLFLYNTLQVCIVFSFTFGYQIVLVFYFVYARERGPNCISFAGPVFVLSFETWFYVTQDGLKLPKVLMMTLNFLPSTLTLQVLGFQAHTMMSNLGSLFVRLFICFYKYLSYKYYRLFYLV